MLVKTETSGFMKDMTTGAFINTDDTSYVKFVAERLKAKNSKELSNKISAVEADIKEIKALLLQVVNGRN
jgi:hypothetical protein